MQRETSRVHIRTIVAKNRSLIGSPSLIEQASNNRIQQNQAFGYKCLKLQLVGEAAVSNSAIDHASDPSQVTPSSFSSPVSGSNKARGRSLVMISMLWPCGTWKYCRISVCEPSTMMISHHFQYKIRFNIDVFCSFQKRYLCLCTRPSHVQAAQLALGDNSDLA